MKLTHQIETYTTSGLPIYRFRITNSQGAYVELSNWGARWITATVPDIHGHLANVLVGYPQLADYLADTYYMGATIGRFANRISGASFILNGITYQLEKNDGRNTNHGGSCGFHQKLWQWEELPDGICFSLFSPDGEGGYPGNIQVAITYQWNEQHELSITYSGTTDQTTYLNLTNHAYFNLTGTTGKITGHHLSIPSGKILATNTEFIPTGEITDIRGTPFDFTTGMPIGEGLYTGNEQLKQNRGYNHCYVLKADASLEMLHAASLLDPETGRVLVVETNMPGILLYTAGYYAYPHTAVCLETQFFPDTPSHPDFPCCLLHAEELYSRKTMYKFGVKRDKNENI